MDGFSTIAPQAAERIALHVEIAVSSLPAQAPRQSMTAVVKAIAASSVKHEAIWRWSGGKTLQIASVRFNRDETRAIFLLQSGAEGHAASAHLVMDLNASTQEVGVYHAMLECVPGVSVASVEQALQGLARKLGAFYFKDRAGRFKEAHPRVTLAKGQFSAFAVERAVAPCEAEIRPDVSAKLDAALRRRAIKRAA